MEIKKIVISPNNKKAIAFFDELNRKKLETFKKIDNLNIFKKVNKKEVK